MMLKLARMYKLCMTSLALSVALLVTACISVFIAPKLQTLLVTVLIVTIVLAAFGVYISRLFVDGRKEFIASQGRRKFAWGLSAVYVSSMLNLVTIVICAVHVRPG